MDELSEGLWYSSMQIIILCRCRAMYARVDPAVIVIATCSPIGDAGQHILLGRNVKWPEARYSALAGFVELGESLEEAACREVLEESDVAV